MLPKQRRALTDTLTAMKQCSPSFQREPKRGRGGNQGKVRRADEELSRHERSDKMNTLEADGFIVSPLQHLKLLRGTRKGQQDHTRHTKARIDVRNN